MREFKDFSFKEQIDHIRKCQANGIEEIRKGSDAHLADIADHLDIWGPWLCNKTEELERKLEVAVEALEFCALGELQFTDGIEQMHKARQALAEIKG